jgi:hypothetical protein
MRRVITIRGISDRNRLHSWVDAAPVGYHVAFTGPSRSLEQNSRMWAMLADIAKAATINGMKYDADQWKCIFMKAMGKDVQFLPTLDGTQFFPTGLRSSDLSVQEMSDLQTFMESWAAERGIELGKAV